MDWRNGNGAGSGRTYTDWGLRSNNPRSYQQQSRSYRGRGSGHHRAGDYRVLVDSTTEVPYDRAFPHPDRYDARRDLRPSRISSTQRPRPSFLPSKPPLSAPSTPSETRAYHDPSVPKWLGQYLAPFRDLPTNLPPFEILASILSPPSSGITTEGSAGRGSVNSDAFCWSMVHSDALRDLIRFASQHSSSSVPPVSSTSNVTENGPESLQGRTLLAHHLCRLVGLATLAAHFGHLSGRLPLHGLTSEERNRVLNVLYDYCECPTRSVRVLGYHSLVTISFSDPTLLRRNVDVLVQLLVVEQEQERRTVHAGLRSLLSLQPETTLDVMLAPDAVQGDMRPLILDFLMSQAITGSPDAAELPLELGPMPSSGGPTFNVRLAHDENLQASLALALVHGVLRPRESVFGFSEFPEQQSVRSWTKYLSSFATTEWDLITRLLLGTDHSDPATGPLSALWGTTVSENAAAVYAARQAVLDTLVVRAMEKVLVLIFLLRGVSEQGRVGPEEGEVQAVYEVVRDVLPRLSSTTKERSVHQAQAQAHQTGHAVRSSRVGTAGPATYRAVQSLLSYLQADEPLVSLFTTSEATTIDSSKRVANIQALYERFRVASILSDNHNSILPEPNPVTTPSTSSTLVRPIPSSVLSLVSPSIRVPLSRISALISLSRRKAAIRHTTIGACDARMVCAFLDGLTFLELPTKPVGELGEWDKEHTTVIEVAEAMFWGLALALPVRRILTFRNSVPKRSQLPFSYNQPSDPTDLPASQKIFQTWVQRTQATSEIATHVSHLRSSERAYLSTLLREIGRIALQLTLPATQRKAQDWVPVWLNISIPLALPSARTLNAPPAFRTGGGTGGSRKRRVDHDQDDDHDHDHDHEEEERKERDGDDARLRPAVASGSQPLRIRGAALKRSRPSFDPDRSSEVDASGASATTLNSDLVRVVNGTLTPVISIRGTGGTGDTVAPPPTTTTANSTVNPTPVAAARGNPTSQSSQHHAAAASGGGGGGDAGKTDLAQRFAPLPSSSNEFRGRGHGRGRGGDRGPGRATRGSRARGSSLRTRMIERR